jgi:hypothetical protein
MTTGASCESGGFLKYPGGPGAWRPHRTKNRCGDAHGWFLGPKASPFFSILEAIANLSDIVYAGPKSESRITLSSVLQGSGTHHLQLCN